MNYIEIVPKEVASISDEIAGACKRALMSSVTEYPGKDSFTNAGRLAPGTRLLGAGSGIADDMPTPGCGISFACGAYRTAEQLHGIK